MDTTSAANNARLPIYCPSYAAAKLNSLVREAMCGNKLPEVALNRVVVRAEPAAEDL